MRPGAGETRRRAGRVRAPLDVPARKAHPGIAVGDVEALALAVGQAGAPVTWDDNIPGLRRFHTTDPVGNRLEFQQAATTA